MFKAIIRNTGWSCDLHTSERCCLNSWWDVCRHTVITLLKCVCVFIGVLYLAAFVNVHVDPNRDNVTGGVCVCVCVSVALCWDCVCCHLCGLFLWCDKQQHTHKHILTHTQTHTDTVKLMWTAPSHFLLLKRQYLNSQTSCTNTHHAVSQFVLRVIYRHIIFLYLCDCRSQANQHVWSHACVCVCVCVDAAGGHRHLFSTKRQQADGAIYNINEELGHNVCVVCVCVVISPSLFYCITWLKASFMVTAFIFGRAT